MSVVTGHEPDGGRRIGLVVPGRRGLASAAGLPCWLLSAARATTALAPVDPPAPVDPLGPTGAGSHDAGRGVPDGGGGWDGYVLLVGQYGPVPAPAVEEAVRQFGTAWRGRPVGLVSYGGVSRGRDAATRVRRTLTDRGAVVVTAGLGVNVARLRAEGGPGAFERVAWELVLAGVLDACARAATP